MDRFFLPLRLGGLANFGGYGLGSIISNNSCGARVFYEELRKLILINSPSLS